MTQQIQQNLSVQARSIQSDIDQMLFERFENAMVWSRSELMEDLRLGDVDKRVTNYLVGLQSGYGDVYTGLECRTQRGLVVASSVASRVGTQTSAEDPAQVSVAARLPGGTATLSLPQTARLDDALPITIETGIPSPYVAQRASSGRLLLSFNAKQISQMLDAASVGQRSIVVVDRQGRWVAGSSRLRGRIIPATTHPPAGSTGTEAQYASGNASPFLDMPALVGSSQSMPTSRFAGSGWTTIVLEPVDAALAPVSKMAVIFAAIFATTLVLTLLAATWLASALSGPIVALTARTRRHQSGQGVDSDTSTRSTIVELDVLARAYDDMVRSVEHSRQELVRSSKMAMLGELAAVLAHEVRTPLGILRSSAQILMRNPGLGADGLELMTFIESETERLNRLVSTMLDTARPRRPELVDCDVHDLLRRCAQMHDLQRGDEGTAHPVLLELRAQKSVLPGDREQLMQVFFNLLSNATQAAGPTGTVRLSTSDDGDFLRATCEDSGAGISPEIRDKVFDPFVSGRSGGFGLGLAVVRQVVVGHQGHIEIETSRLGGAAFSIWLPHHAPERAQEGRDERRDDSGS
jgi:signal transduction histidine kinase